MFQTVTEAGMKNQQICKICVNTLTIDLVGYVLLYFENYLLI